MRKQWLLPLLILLVLMPFLPAPAQGRIRFEVPKVDMHVFVQKDGSAHLVYDIVFANVRGSPIPIVDMGLPHTDYDRNSLKASMNGRPVTSFRPSENVESGVTAVLGALEIPVGEGGDFHFEVTVRDLVFQDSTQEDLASFQITPTWFGSQYVSGSTNLAIWVHLPPGVNPDSVVYHDLAFTDKRTEDDSVIVGWRFPSTTFTHAHLIGLSFPKTAMVPLVTTFEKEGRATRSLVAQFEENGAHQVVSGILLLVLFSLMFFRYTDETGISVFIGLLFLLFIVLAVIAAVRPILQLLLWPVLLVGGIWAEWMRRRGRTLYIPPLAILEGGGEGEGFTAPEAAILLELPLPKVCSMVLAQLLKKGVLRQVAGRDQKILEVAPEFRGSRRERRRAASNQGIVLHRYEQAFLDAISSTKSPSIADVDFNEALKEMIENVAERTVGCDLKEMRKYYRAMVKRAWTDLESQREKLDRDKVAEQHFEWLVLGEDSRDRFRSWESRGYYYHPHWYPSHWSSGEDACTWLDSTCTNVQDNINVDFGGGLPKIRGGDAATGPVLRSIRPSPVESGSSSGWGGGGGCACACAGCACACACAGGGV